MSRLKFGICEHDIPYIFEKNSNDGINVECCFLTTKTCMQNLFIHHTALISPLSENIIWVALLFLGIGFLILYLLFNRDILLLFGIAVPFVSLPSSDSSVRKIFTVSACGHLTNQKSYITNTSIHHIQQVGNLRSGPSTHKVI